MQIIPENVEALIRGQAPQPERIVSVDCPAGVEIEKGATFKCVVRFDDGTQEKVTIVQLDDSATSRSSSRRNPLRRQLRGRLRVVRQKGAGKVAAWTAVDERVELREDAQSADRGPDLERRSVRPLAGQRAVGQERIDAVELGRQLGEVLAHALGGRADRLREPPRERQLVRAWRAAAGNLSNRAIHTRASSCSVSAQRIIRRGTGWSSASPHRSASSTFARASASDGYRAGSGLIRSSSRAIARDVSTRRPSIFNTGTVLPRKPASRTSTGWRPAGNIVTRWSIPLCSSMSRAACPGCESLIA